MTSWRELISPTAVDDVEAIVAAAFEIAEHALIKRGELFPFGLTINHHGQRSITHADPGAGNDNVALASLASLWEGFGQRGRDLRVAAATADVLDDGHDAIRVEVEHEDRLALTIVRRYRQVPDGRYTWGEMSVSQGESRVWLTV